MTFETSIIRDVCIADDIRLKYLEQRDVEIVKYFKNNTSIIPTINSSVNLLKQLIEKNSSFFDENSSVNFNSIINNISIINSSIDTINSSIKDIKSSYVKSITITEQQDTNITKEDENGNIIPNPSSYIFNIYNISTNKGDTVEDDTIIVANYRFVELYMDTSTTVDKHDSSIKDIQSKLPIFIDIDEDDSGNTDNP